MSTNVVLLVDVASTSAGGGGGGDGTDGGGLGRIALSKTTLSPQ